MRTLVLIASLLAATQVVAADRVVRESIPVNADVRFSLDAYRSSVSITTADVDAIELVVRLEHDEQEILDKVNVDIESSPAFVSVGVSFDEPDLTYLFGFIDVNNYEYPQIHFEVVLPVDAALAIDGHRSRLDIVAPGGRLDISAHRSSGRIDEVRSDLKLSSQRGDFEVQIRELHDVDLETSRGDIRLDIFGARDYRLSGESERGNIRFSGQEIAVGERRRGVFVEHVAGAGTHFINLEAHRGDIRINFRD